MSFDIRAAENKPVVDFIKTATALLVDPSSTARTTVRKMLADMGAITANVDIAESFEEAETKLKKMRPMIMFVDFNLDKHTGIELYEMQRAARPEEGSRLLFILLSEVNSPTVTAAAADADVDALVIKPFTYAALQERFVEALASKVSPTDYFKHIEEGKKKLDMEDFDEAAEDFAKARPLDPKPTLAIYYQGHCMRMLGKAAEAQKFFEEALKIDAKHYKTLFGLFDLYNSQKDHKKAYELGLTITQAYPLPPKRIPEFIHLSISNGRYDDIMGFYQMFSETEKPDDQSMVAIAAGFVIAGKFHLRKGENKEALEALKKAQLLARGKVSILREVVVSLFNAGLTTEAATILGQLPDEVKQSPEITVALVEQTIQRGGDKTAAHGQLTEAISRGAKSKSLFELALKLGKELGMPGAKLEELVTQATAAFPDHKAQFEALLK